MGEEPNHATPTKALPSINHSILSGCQAGEDEDYNTRVVGTSPGTFFREIKLG